VNGYEYPSPTNWHPDSCPDHYPPAVNNSKPISGSCVIGKAGLVAVDPVTVDPRASAHRNGEMPVAADIGATARRSRWFAAFSVYSVAIGPRSPGRWRR
jgi:hypothetical protein